MLSVSGNFNVFTENSAKRENILRQKHVIVRCNVSDDGDMFKEKITRRTTGARG